MLELGDWGGSGAVVVVPVVDAVAVGVWDCLWMRTEGGRDGCDGDWSPGPVMSCCCCCGSMDWKTVMMRSECHWPIGETYSPLMMMMTTMTGLPAPAADDVDEILLGERGIGGSGR